MGESKDKIDDCPCDIDIRIIPPKGTALGEWFGTSVIDAENYKNSAARKVYEAFLSRNEVDIYKSGLLIGSAWITSFSIGLDLETGGVVANVIFQGNGKPAVVCG